LGLVPGRRNQEAELQALKATAVTAVG